ncbi:MAG: hypothetical protein KAH32_06755 [Chlamydiia bacterium]|nr:hypothetical protein [Chlamydiia bacterium]
MTFNCPNISEHAIREAIKLELKNVDIKGFISEELVMHFFNILAWDRFYGNSKRAFVKPEGDLKLLFDGINLGYFNFIPLVEASLILYSKLSRLVNLRSLLDGDVLKLGDGDNKKYTEDDFIVKELFDEYALNSYELPESFLGLNKLFEVSDKKDVVNIQSFNDVIKIHSKSAMARPDFLYKLAKRDVKINKDVIKSDHDDRKIIVVQDLTESMKVYIDKLHVLRSYIINIALKHGYEVIWLLYDIDEYKRYKIKTLDDAANMDKFEFHKGTFNPISTVFTEEFRNLDIIFITDGTDSTFKPINAITKSINTILFTDNINFKQQMTKYGKIFQT